MRIRRRGSGRSTSSADSAPSTLAAPAARTWEIPLRARPSLPLQGEDESTIPASSIWTCTIGGVGVGMSDDGHMRHLPQVAVFSFPPAPAPIPSPSTSRFPAPPPFHAQLPDHTKSSRRLEVHLAPSVQRALGVIDRQHPHLARTSSTKRKGEGAWRTSAPQGTSACASRFAHRFPPRPPRHDEVHPMYSTGERRRPRAGAAFEGRGTCGELGEDQHGGRRRMEVLVPPSHTRSLSHLVPRLTVLRSFTFRIRDVLASPFIFHHPFSSTTTTPSRAALYAPPRPTLTTGTERRAGARDDIKTDDPPTPSCYSFGKIQQVESRAECIRRGLQERYAPESSHVHILPSTLAAPRKRSPRFFAQSASRSAMQMRKGCGCGMEVEEHSGGHDSSGTTADVHRSALVFCCYSSPRCVLALVLVPLPRTPPQAAARASRWDWTSFPRSGGAGVLGIAPASPQPDVHAGKGWQRLDLRRRVNQEVVGPAMGVRHRAYDAERSREAIEQRLWSIWEKKAVSETVERKGTAGRIAVREDIERANARMERKGCGPCNSTAKAGTDEGRKKTRGMARTWRYCMANEASVPSESDSGTPTDSTFVDQNWLVIVHGAGDVSGSES
ncbi:hypothetical protein K438DRAFT_1767583 [Mycena galopus ATCC 62051]|nr:hypothetical protein K438DRAFT_1767583 [Mycena galopus ATCC 62051]